ncbi:MAG: glycosyltransferase family A protein, partial [Verrucomicrobiia bacterium]
MPPISVLITTYGRPDYLEQALNSVAHQTIQPAEVVVSDNHPTRSAEDVVEKFRSRLPIRRVCPPKPLTMDAHWLWAFRQPEGEWIAFLEDDNLWRANHLHALLQGLEHFPKASIWGTVAELFQEDAARSIHTEAIAPPWVIDVLALSPLLVSPRAALATAL